MIYRLQLSLFSLLFSVPMLLAVPASAEPSGRISGELTPEELTSYAIFYSDYEPTFWLKIPGVCICMSGAAINCA